MRHRRHNAGGIARVQYVCASVSLSVCVGFMLLSALYPLEAFCFRLYVRPLVIIYCEFVSMISLTTRSWEFHYIYSFGAVGTKRN